MAAAEKGNEQPGSGDVDYRSRTLPFFDNHGNVILDCSSLEQSLGCSLCSGFFEDPYTIIECNHSFCKHCIFQWFLTHQSCPKCKVDLSPHPNEKTKPDHMLESLLKKIFPEYYGLPFSTDVVEKNEPSAPSTAPSNVPVAKSTGEKMKMEGDKSAEEVKHINEKASLMGSEVREGQRSDEQNESSIGKKEDSGDTKNDPLERLFYLKLRQPDVSDDVDIASVTLSRQKFKTSPSTTTKSIKKFILKRLQMGEEEWTIDLYRDNSKESLNGDENAFLSDSDIPSFEYVPHRVITIN